MCLRISESEREHRERRDAVVATDEGRGELRRCCRAGSSRGQTLCSELSQLHVLVFCFTSLKVENFVSVLQVCDVGYPARVNACKLLIEVENFDVSSRRQRICQMCCVESAFFTKGTFSVFLMSL